MASRLACWKYDFLNHMLLPLRERSKTKLQKYPHHVILLQLSQESLHILYWCADQVQLLRHVQLHALCHVFHACYLGTTCHPYALSAAELQQVLPPFYFFDLEPYIRGCL
jgi:hypothetical protein